MIKVEQIFFISLVIIIYNSSTVETMKLKHQQFNKNILIFNPTQKSLIPHNINGQTLLIDTYQQVLNLQQTLIKELNVNKHLIKQFLTKDQQQTIKSKNKQTEIEKDFLKTNFLCKNGPLRQNPSMRKYQIKQSSQSSQYLQQRKHKKINKKISSGSCYDPQSQNSQKQKIKTIRQTKHIPKNYGKAIINFMLKNSQIVEDLCLKYEKNKKELWKVVDSYKGKIYTVAHLRSMWLDRQNKFAPIFRTMSMFYLRKHSLPHIFNSRVQNHNRHLKYRYKIIQAVKNPQSFFRIKEY